MQIFKGTRVLKKLLFSIICLVLVSMSTNAWAAPSLGVAVDGGTYFSTTGASQGWTDAFTNDYQSDGGGQTEGFLTTNGTALTLFVNSNDASDSIFTSTIYLLTDDSASSSSSDGDPITGVTFDGLALTAMDTGQIDGYKPSDVYDGVSLGTVSTNSDWVLTTGLTGFGTVYLYTGTIAWLSGDLDGDDHFFLAADTGGGGIFGNGDQFSPKTTSAVGGGDNPPVPEPATIALLGIGLIGLVGASARKKLKKTKKH